MSEISNRLDVILASKHITRADLSRATNIPPSTIRSWTHGVMPSVDCIYRVAKYLGVTMEWLTSGQDYLDKNNYVLTSDELELVERYRNLDDRDQNAVRTLNKALESQYMSSNSLVAIKDDENKLV